MLRTFGLRIWFGIWFHELRSDLYRVVLCKHGFHSVYSSGERWTLNSEEIVLQTYYMGCRHCETIFFPTQYQKEMYLRIKEHEKAMWSNLVKTAVEGFKGTEAQKEQAQGVAEAVSELVTKPERKPKCDVLEHG